MTEVPPRKILITGATSGLGFRCLESFLVAGSQVIGVGSSVDSIERAWARLRINRSSTLENLSLIPFDLSSREEADYIREFPSDLLSGTTCFIHSAAVAVPVARATDLRLEDSERLFLINYFSATVLTKLLVPHITAAGGGSIINIVGSNGYNADPLFSHYGASKGALISYTLSIAEELRGHGIRVNGVLPGNINTEMTRKKIASGNRVLPKQILEHFYKRLSQDDSLTDVTEFILWLSSKQASEVTGKILSARFDKRDSILRAMGTDNYQLRRTVESDK